MARSLNRVQLIGNLTRDPELRYTPSGAAVCTFSLATNRNWTTDSGEKKEEVDFHRIVSWNKLAEICSQFLVKGRKVYVEGRLSTRSWTAQDGAQRSTTEVVIDDMILLDNKRPDTGASGQVGQAEGTTGAKKTEETKGESETEEKGESLGAAQDKKKPTAKRDQEPIIEPSEDEVTPDDIPF